MPNWCNNSLRVIGEEKRINDFIKDFKEKGFEAVLPIPSNLQGIEHNNECVQWCNRHWGTKGAEPSSIEQENNTLFFDTAWSPPSKEFLTKASEKYGVDIELFYQEDMGGFEGLVHVIDGKVAKNIFLDDLTNPKNVELMISLETLDGLLDRLENDADCNDADIDDIRELAEKGEWDKIFKSIYPF